MSDHILNALGDLIRYGWKIKDLDIRDRDTYEEIVITARRDRDYSPVKHPTS